MWDNSKENSGRLPCAALRKELKTMIFNKCLRAPSRCEGRHRRAGSGASAGREHSATLDRGRRTQTGIPRASCWLTAEPPMSSSSSSPGPTRGFRTRLLTTPFPYADATLSSGEAPDARNAPRTTEAGCSSPKPLEQARQQDSKSACRTGRCSIQREREQIGAWPPRILH